jgi:hypothetical protein
MTRPEEVDPVHQAIKQDTQSKSEQYETVREELKMVNIKMDKLTEMLIDMGVQLDDIGTGGMNCSKASESEEQ